jgi:DNA-binding transcriptional LysR family regulator
MSYWKYKSPLEPPMDQIPPALRAEAVDLAVGFIPELRSGVRQQLLFESDYVALARRGPATIGSFPWLVVARAMT